MLHKAYGNYTAAHLALSATVRHGDNVLGPSRHVAALVASAQIQLCAKQPIIAVVRWIGFPKQP